MDAKEWIDSWAAGDIGFHQEDRNKLLVKHGEKMIAGRSNIKILVPLCGKAVDMKCLYDAGHTVVGIEIADQALKEFFTESKIAYTSEPLTAFPGTLYKSADGRIRLYACNLFDFSVNVEGKFDAVWDRGSLIALNKEDISRYCELMLSLIDKNTRYILETFEYDEAELTGPPHSISLAKVRQLFGDCCQAELIESVDTIDEHWREMGVTHINVNLYLLTAKA